MIALYERSAEMNPFSSKFDAWQAGKCQLTEEEKLGYELFKEKGLCAECHILDPDERAGKVLFTDHTYDNLGIPSNPGNPFFKVSAPYNTCGKDTMDLGLGSRLRDPEEYGKFRVPTLRNIAVTGDSLNEVNEAVRKNGRLRWIHVRHEETGAYAAAAEAQLTGELACCAGSSGPGHVHLINGLYDAQRSGARVLAIASTIPSREFGTEYFQETNTIKLFDDCSYYNQVATTPEQFPRMLQGAMQAAISSCGVGVIGLPGDLAAENATAGLSSTFSFPTRQRVCPAEQEIRELADLLNNAKKVTLYCGIGAKDAHPELVQLAKYEKVRENLRSAAAVRGKEEKIQPEYVISVVDELSSDDAIFTVDTGMTCVWGARYLQATGMRKMLGSFNHGSMANAMPQAIGAALAYPGRQVVALCGDGGISMLLGDLATIVQYHLPIKLIVFNNRSLGMVKLEMEVAGLPDWQTTMLNPDFARVALSMGMAGYNVINPDDVFPTLQKVFNADGPALVNIMTDPNALAMPPKIEFSQMLGFAQTMYKLMMEGRSKEVLDTIDTNLKHWKDVF